MLDVGIHRLALRDVRSAVRQRGCDMVFMAVRASLERVWLS